MPSGVPALPFDRQSINWTHNSESEYVTENESPEKIIPNECVG